MVGDSLEGPHGSWQFYIESRPMFCFTDETLNRMRIISPISLVETLEKAEIMAALTANFHTALDSKYAISEDIMWSVFIHPLKELSNEQTMDAIQQVYKAAETFGTTYSSTDLIFPGGLEKEKGKEKEKKPAKKM